MSARIQENKLLTVSTASELILGGRVLVIFGDEALLTNLPKGNWIGGTTPYFYLKNECGRLDRTKVFVSDFTEAINDYNIITLEEHELPTIGTGGFENGFSFLAIPGLQQIHHTFALNSLDYPNILSNPLIGLIAGTTIDEYGNGKLPKVINGKTLEVTSLNAVVMHCSLLPSKVARMEIVNVFERSNKNSIEVFEDTFTVKDCLINGELANLYHFIEENEIDVQNPLVCDYAGAAINVSFQFLNKTTKEVSFYAPLFKGKKYFFTKKELAYHEAFAEKISDVLLRETNIIYNCNSILNYLYGELDKHDIGFSGTAAFGEIAYGLLNQTFVYLAIDE